MYKVEMAEKLEKMKSYKELLYLFVNSVSSASVIQLSLGLIQCREVK